jgi:hypothetical protein
MDGTSPRVAALVATALFAFAASDARAQSEDPASGAAQAGPAAETSAQQTSPGTSSPAGGEVTPSAQDVPTVLVTQDPPAASTPPAPPVQANPSATVPPPGTPPGAPQSASTTPPPPSQGLPSDPQPAQLKETPATSSTSVDGQASGAAAATPVGTPPAQAAPPPPPPAPAALTQPVKPPAVPAAGPSKAASRPDADLARLLTDVDRHLHDVQGKIHDLRHRLAHGAPPPTRRLIDLRTSLVRVAPLLAALEVSLDAVGRLSPHLQHLLHRVSHDLHKVRAAAGGLVTALRNSAVRGPEMRLLVEELEHVASFHLALPSSPAVGPAPAPSPRGAGAGLPAVQSGPAFTPPASAATPTRSASAPRTDGSPRDRGFEGRGAEEAPPSPWSSAAGAASASPGGGLFFAAVASLATLLIGLVLPAIRARLDLPAGGRYTVALLTALERPG